MRGAIGTPRENYADLMEEVMTIMGPVMIGPSSSHTAGPLKLAFAARELFGVPIMSARIVLGGSLGATGKGHGTPQAVVAGLMGWASDDRRVPRALELARSSGLKFEVVYAPKLGNHPNEMSIDLTGDDPQTMRLRGASLGGGKVQLLSVDGFKVSLFGTFPTLIVYMLDRPGVIAGVTGLLSERDLNVAFMSVARKRKGEDALMSIEMDDDLDDDLIERVGQLRQVKRVRVMSPL